MPRPKPKSDFGFDPKYLEGATWRCAGLPVEHVETHAAHIFLCSDLAYKIKKPVRYSYLDFSTLEKRRQILHQELELNKRFAPSLYKQVIEVLGEPALVMRRFAASALLSNIVLHTQLDEAICTQLAEMVAKSHTMVAASNAKGGDIMLGLSKQLENTFRANPKLFPKTVENGLSQRFQELVESLWALLNVRSSKGLVRHCHGDMHCENIIIENGMPTLFDAVEFNERIATVDVLYDLAFLLMDLIRFDQRKAANTVLNTYLDLRRNEEDLSGLAALPLFLATRAGVRALVAADRLSGMAKAGAASYQVKSRLYFEACARYVAKTRPTLVCIGGLSGSGKSTVAKQLAHLVGAAPGALLVRSDVERKHIAGVSVRCHISPAYYTVAASRIVYHEIMARARSALSAGHSVILDAVFAEEGQRVLAEALARQTGASFLGLWLDAPLDKLKRRVTGRVGDASDATPNVVDVQHHLSLGHINWRRIDASGTLQHTIDNVQRAFEQQDPAYHVA